MEVLRPMNQSEKAVYEYLQARGFENVVHEPDGKVPPDFLLDGRIAVEVRRLNQNEQTGLGHRGLEETARPFDAAFRKILARFGPSTTGSSWFVAYTFSRPLPPWKDVERLLAGGLQEFKYQPNHESCQIRVSRHIRLRFIRASDLHATFFVPGWGADHDSGGFVIAELERNLRLCIAEKTRKVAKVRHKYPEWWLALEDRIGHGVLDESDRRELRELVQADGDWAKIILVNPLSPVTSFEL